jgi:hypothetical protein
VTNTLPPPARSTNGVRTFSLAEQANALGVVLRKEFGVPFAFYHATTGEPVIDRVPNDSDSRPPCPPGSAARMLPAQEVVRLAADSQSEVTALADGRYQLTMVFYDSGKPLVVAAGLFVGLAHTPEETEREHEWLGRWVQSVSDRLRLMEQFQRQQPSAAESVTVA